MTDWTRANPPQCESIHWIDSAATAEWSDTDKAATDLQFSRVRTVGWVIEEDGERILVAANHLEDWSQVGELITIPLAAIVGRQVIPVI